MPGQTVQGHNWLVLIFGKHMQNPLEPIGPFRECSMVILRNFEAIWYAQCLCLDRQLGHCYLGSRVIDENPSNWIQTERK